MATLPVRPSLPLRRAVFAVAAAGAAAAATISGSALAATEVPAAGIPLPDASQLAANVNPTDLLGADRPNEVVNRAPGPVDDTEHVVVGLAPDGTPASVTVDQQLVVNGVGDFSLKIPGPALDVRAAADASNRPGLRRGSVVWEGFAGGHKELDAEIELHPEIEQLRLPLAVSVTEGEVRIENRTAIPVPMVDGEPEQGAAEGVLAAVRAQLGAGTAPVAGAGGLPAAIPGAAGAIVDVPVAAPFHVHGEVASPAGSVPFDAVVPGAGARDGVLVVPATGTVRFTAEPALPDPALLGSPTGRAAVRAVEIAMWATLRRADVAAYLGNPRPGTSTTSFTYEPAAAPRTVPRKATERPKPFAIAIAVSIGLVLAAGAAAAWARN